MVGGVLEDEADLDAGDGGAGAEGDGGWGADGEIDAGAGGAGLDVMESGAWVGDGDPHGSGSGVWQGAFHCEGSAGTAAGGVAPSGEIVFESRVGDQVLCLEQARAGEEDCGDGITGERAGHVFRPGG